MADRQRLNESVSVRLTSDDRRTAESLCDGDCSGFLRLSGRIFARSLLFLQEDIQTNLGGKTARVIEGGEVAVMRSVVRLLWSGQLDTRVEVQRVGDWWIWVAVDGLAVRYGAVTAKAGKKELPFPVAIKYSKEATEPDPVQFWEWAEIESVGRVWTFGDACNG